jgi:hypothetical protein
MRTTEQINSFWELARQRSVEGEVLRRRIAAIGGLAVGFCGFLLAIGLGVVVLVFLAGIVVSVGVAALFTLWPRLCTFGGTGIAYIRDCSRAIPGQLVPHWRSVASAAPHGVGGRARTQQRPRARGCRAGLPCEVRRRSNLAGDNDPVRSARGTARP